MPLPPKPETIEVVIKAARDRGTPSALAVFPIRTIADVIISLADRPAPATDPAPMKAKPLRVPHAVRVQIVQEARDVLNRVTSGDTFLDRPVIAITGAIVDLADILIATKEELQKAQNRRPPEPRMSPEKVVAEVLQHGLDAVDWIEPPDLAAAVMVLAKAPAKDNEVLTDAHMEGVRILATAVKKLWPDLADEVVKRWLQYKAGEQQYLNELIERLRK